MPLCIHEPVKAPIINSIKIADPVLESWSSMAASIFSHETFKKRMEMSEVTSAALKRAICAGPAVISSPKRGTVMAIMETKKNNGKIERSSEGRFMMIVKYNCRGVRRTPDAY